jgi:hypothetical protein
MTPTGRGVALLRKTLETRSKFENILTDFESLCGSLMGVRRGLSKGVLDGRRPPALQGVEGSSMAGPGDTLGRPWPPFAIRPWVNSGA